MPALVKRSISSGSRVRVEWLCEHAAGNEEIMRALSRIDRGELVAISPRVDEAVWTPIEADGLLFATLELATAVARLHRVPAFDRMIWAEPRITGELPQRGRVTEVGTRRYVSPAKCRRVHSADPLERDWHQRAVNSGGQD